ncbi:MAG TPA: hypothetical protein PLB00_03825 [Pseudomonadota bacterium]|nr:hypothetical protein [Pseudomonadota bacterium]
MSVVRSALLLVAIACAGVAQAATYVVDTTSADAGVSGCDDATANDCAMAGAIAKANASTGVVDTIHFNIPTGDPGCHAAQGWCVIAGSGDLTVNEALTIDGFTQPGAAANTIAANVGGLNAVHRIQINPGLRFTAPGLVRGLVLNGRGNNQVWPLLYANPNLTTDEFRVEGNAFGEALDGGASMVTWALVIQSRSPVRVGGLQAAARNLFCKAGAALVNHTNSGKLRVYGNLFGVNAGGNSMSGCAAAEAIDGNFPYYDDDYIDFGSNDPNGRNIVARQGLDITPKNMSFGIQSLAPVVVRGNHFGLGADGVTPLALEYAYIASNVSALMFGGDQPGDGNIVVGPAGGSFAAVDTGSINRGAVFGNHFIGTQLKPWYLRYSAGDGPLMRRPNDAGDGDGSNGGRDAGAQNHPEILAFSLQPDGLHIGYRVDSGVANTRYPLQVEFYSAITQAPRDRLGVDTYTAAEAQSIKQIVLPTPPGGWPANAVVIASALASMPPAPSSRESSEIGWHPVTMGFAPGTSAATIDHVANTVSVDVATPAPFVPRGTVRIAYTWSSFTYQYCDAMLVATGPSSARATCTLAAGNPGLHVLRAVMTSNDVPFADAATGGNPNVWMDHAVVANDLFKDSFE